MKPLIDSSLIIREEAIRVPAIGKRFFYSYASYPMEYIYDIEPTQKLLLNLKQKGVDLFSFINMTYTQKMPRNHLFHRDLENIAIMKINSYEKWWMDTLKKKERQSVKKAQKCGVDIRNVEVNTNFLKEVQKIYNETPYREGRRYSGYGLSLDHLRDKFTDYGNSDILGAYFGGQLIGLLWLTYGDRAAMFRSFVSLIKHRDKCPNNALISGAVKSCCGRRISYLIYGNHYGFLPSLDAFREHQGFRKVPLPRYYIPLSERGELAVRLGLHRKIEYSIPLVIERALLELYVPVSRILPATVWWRFGGE